MRETTVQGHPGRSQNFERNVRTLRATLPAVMEAFWGLHKNVVAAGALDTKTKELIALAISVATRATTALHTTLIARCKSASS